MKLSNKWVIGLGVASFIVMTGCSDDSSGDTDSDQTTIRLHHWYNEDQDKWNEVFAAYEEQTGVRIESVTPENNDANETMQQIDLAAASGDQLDVIMVNSATNYAQRISQGMFEPLNGYMEDAGINYSDDYQNDTSFEGDYYALPGKYNQSFIMLNKDALDEAGLDIPVDWTWDEYMDYASALTEGEGSSKRYGTYFHTWIDYVKLITNIQPENSDLIKDDGVTSNINSDSIRQSLEIRQRGMDEGSATPHADTISLDLNYRTQFFSESAAMISTGSWMISEAGGRPDEPSPFTTAFAPYPKTNKGDAFRTPPGIDFLTVYSGSDYKQEAFDFIRWYTTEGILDQGMYYPDYKGADTETVLETLLENTPNSELVDRDSLLETLEVGEPAELHVPVPYLSEVVTAYMNETDRFLLGEQDLETTIERADESVQQIIDSNSN